MISQGNPLQLLSGNEKPIKINNLYKIMICIKTEIPQENCDNDELKAIYHSKDKKLYMDF